MPVTGTDRLNIFTRRVMSATDLGPRFRDALESAIKRHTKAFTTGPEPTADAGGWFKPATVTDGAGADHLDFGDCYGVDGDGNFISVDAGSTYLNEVPFEDAVGVTYYMGAATAEVPQGVGIDLSTGDVKYDYTKLELCDARAPTLVVDGGGFLTFTLGNHAFDLSDDFTGRTAVIWMVDPESPTSSVAIETVLLTGAKTVVSAGVFGQSSVSTFPAHYMVAIMGPTITRNLVPSYVAGYAYIGTVIGGASPRVFNDSVQIPLVSMADTAAAFSELLTPGWITVPNVTDGTTQVNVTQPGSVYSQGRIQATATDTITWAYTTSTVWASWNPTIGGFQAYNSWHNATVANVVPLAVWQVDGGGNVIAGSLQPVARSVAEFNETMVLTVSGTAAHNPQFQTLESALAFAYSIQQGTSPGPRNIIIELIGDVDVAAPIDQLEQYPQAITIRSRDSHPPLAAMSSVDVATSRIHWSTASSLFELPDGASMIDWTFQGILFEYLGTSASVQDAVINAVSPSGTRDIHNLTFKGCSLMANAFAAIVGASSQPLPSLIHVSGVAASAITGLTMIDCDWMSEEAVISLTVDLSDLSVRNVTVNQLTTSTPTHGGFLRTTGKLDAATITQSNMLNLNGYFIEVGGGWEDIRITDNVVTVITALDVGVIWLNAGIGDGSDGLWLHDNRLSLIYSIGASTTHCVLLSSDAPTGLRGNNVFIHSNSIDGDGNGSATHAGIYVSNNGATTDISGYHIFGNSIVNVGFGVQFAVDDSSGGSMSYGVVFGNTIRAGDYGVDLDDSDLMSVMGNIIDMDATGRGVSGDGTYISVSSNVFASGGSGSAVIESLSNAAFWSVSSNLSDTSNPFMSAFASSVVNGNNTLGSITSTAADNSIVSANVCTSLTITGTDTALVGNVLSGDYVGTLVDGAVCGNSIEGAFTENGDYTAISGNSIDGNTTLSSTSSYTTFAGNVVDGSMDVNGLVNCCSANHFDLTVDTAVGANEATFVANYIVGVYTDAGTGSLALGNNS